MHLYLKIESDKIHIHTCMDACMNTPIHTCMHAHTTHTYTCTHAHTHTHTHTYTHIHTDYKAIHTIMLSRTYIITLFINVKRTNLMYFEMSLLQPSQQH